MRPQCSSGAVRDDRTQDINIDIRLIPKRSISSEWTAGQLYFTAEGTRAGSRVTSIQVSQSGQTVTGVFATAEGGTGTFTGRVDGTSFIGSLLTEFVVGPRLDRRCHGLSPTAGGLVTPGYVAITADAMGFENCAGAAPASVTLQP